jgi:hypothetical protein
MKLRTSVIAALCCIAAPAIALHGVARADETCNSPYLAKLI